MDLFTAEGYRFINEAAQRANYIGVGCRKIYYYRLNNTESATTKYDIRQSMGALYALKCIEEDLIIRTPYVMGALYVHVWLNHFWNLRQILGTDTISENEELFKQSIRYIKQNVFYVAKTEPSFKKKIKYLLAGVFPVFAAKFQNMQLARQLRADVARQENIDEQI